MTAPDDPLATFTVAAFTPHLGEAFRIHSGAGDVLDTVLVEAEVYGPGIGRDQFSLVFRSPPGVELPQAIYRVEHDILGAMELFLVPIGPDGDAMRYEAVFT